MRAVAAGHPATAEAGAEILEAGGSAADCVVAACLASCVAETVMTGLLGGGHAIYFDAATGRAANLDCFVAVPGLGREGEPVALLELEVPFGTELVHYAVGIGSCGVPGVPAGLEALWQAHGRLPWPRLVEPALRLARGAVPMPAAHAACLRMLAPVMTMNEGARIYSPGGELLAEGDLLRQPGLVAALEALAEEGPRSAYDGTIGARPARADGGARRARHAEDLSAYEARWSDPVEVEFRGYDVRTRAGLSDFPAALARLAELRGLERAGTRAGARRRAPRTKPPPQNGTTNISAIDADGNACVLTTSLGLGSGDFVPGFDLHLNSMLGEADLLTGPLEPGERMASMMAPTIALDARRRRARCRRCRRDAAAERAPAGRRGHPRRGPRAAGRGRPPAPPPRRLARPPRAGLRPGDHWRRSSRPASRFATWPDRHHYFGGVSASRATAPRAILAETAPPRRLRLTRARSAARVALDVARDLRDQLLLALERASSRSRSPELDDEPPAVEVALEVEQERLDAALAAAVVRVRPDRDGGAVLPGRAGVDPVLRHEELRADVEVRRREAERAAARVACDDDAFDLDRPPEQLRRALDVALAPRARGSGVDETPSSSGTGTVSKPRLSRSPRSPLRPRPKRKSSPATTISAPIGRSTSLRELLRLEPGDVERELDDERRLDAELAEQLEPPLERREQLDPVPERRPRVRVERDDGRLGPRRERGFDHAPVPEVDAVEGPERDARGPASSSVGSPRDLHRSSAASASVGRDDPARVGVRDVERADVRAPAGSRSGRRAPRRPRGRSRPS